MSILIHEIQIYIRRCKVSNIHYKTNDKSLDASTFIHMANQIWADKYDLEFTREALEKTINTTAWDDEKLVGCARVLTDGYYFGTITEVLVLTEYQRKGIGKRLMDLAFDTSPTSLFFGAQPESVGFYESIGYEKSMQSFIKKKTRKR